MSVYRRWLRPVLFQLDAEFAHAATLRAAEVAGRLPFLGNLLNRRYAVDLPELHTQIAGLSFQNPIGLAAGWDKSGRAIRLLDRMGLGHVEIGSISARPSAGNPGKRLFRLPEDRAIVVNYGLPNDGCEVVAQRLQNFASTNPLGVNIVKTNSGPDAPPETLDDIFADYVASVTRLHQHADYLVLNLSCPNVSAGVDLFAQPGMLRELLTRLTAIPLRCPLFLKLLPVPDAAFLEQTLSECDDFAWVSGFAFNLPSGKPSDLKLSTPAAVWSKMPGAVAGRPAAHRINACVRELWQRMPAERYHIIAAGGVFTAEDAYEKIRLGASLVQIYSALIFEGPAAFPAINRGVAELLQRDGFSHVHQAVGSASRRPAALPV